MTATFPSLDDYNGWADFWRYIVGSNVFPAETQNKETWFRWKEYQDKPIPEEQHNKWKAEKAFAKGMAVIAGKCWFGSNAGLYLNEIDADNIQAIQEICTRDGKTISVEDLANWTLVEQHLDDVTRMHVYILSQRPFPRKSTTHSTTGDVLPAIEVKGLGQHGIMFCTPSIHKNGHQYQIVGGTCHEPALADDFVNHIDHIYRKYGLKYLEANFEGDYYPSKTLIEELFKSDFKVEEGHNRHEALLRVMESLISRNIGILPPEMIKEFARKWNEQHCVPPLDSKEFEKQWKCAARFVVKHNYSSNNDRGRTSSTSTTYGSTINNNVIDLELLDDVKRTDIVSSFVFDRRSSNLILSLNDRYNGNTVISSVISKKWVESIKGFEKQMMQKGVKPKHIRKLLCNIVDSNHEKILDLNSDSDSESEGKQRQLESAAQKILNLARMQCDELFIDQYGIPYAAVKIRDHIETMSLNHTRFKNWISKAYYEKEGGSSVPNSETITNVLNVLRANAEFDGKKRELELRVAAVQEKSSRATTIYYDLCNKEWDVVKITVDGWTIEKSPIVFRRYMNNQPQVYPSREYTPDIFNQFMKLLNVKGEDNKLLLKCYIIASFIPGIQQPILMLHGDPGAAKTTLQEIVKMLVDPSSVLTLTLPRDQNELIQQLAQRRVVFYDNLSKIPDWMNFQRTI